MDDVYSSYRSDLSSISQSLSSSLPASASNLHSSTVNSNDAHYQDIYNQTTTILLKSSQSELMKLLKGLNASEVHNMPLFTDEFLERIKNSLQSSLLPVCTLCDHSILKSLCSINHEAAVILDEFDHSLNPSSPIVQYLMPAPSQMVELYSHTHIVLSVTCEHNGQILLQDGYNMRAMLMKRCCITEHALQLLGVQITNHDALFYWMIPKCVVSLIRMNMIIHSHHLQEFGIVKASIQFDHSLTTDDSTLVLYPFPFPNNASAIAKMQVRCVCDYLYQNSLHSYKK